MARIGSPRPAKRVSSAHGRLTDTPRNFSEPREPTLREVFEGHHNYVHKTLAQLGVADADLDDLTQEVFITVHRKLAEFEWRSRLRTWIYGICLRRAADYRRLGYIRRERAYADPGSGDATSESALPIARVERQTALQALLEGIDGDKRQVLVLYEIDGLSMKEVANAVGCPLQTAYTRLYAAREQLLAAFAAQKARDACT